MALDVNSERGKQTVLDEDEAARIFESNYFGLKYLRTPKLGEKASAAIDAVVVNNAGTVRYVVETKCRYGLPLDVFRTHPTFKNEWLLTYQKLVNLSSGAALFRVQAIGLVYLIESAAVLVVQLADHEGNILPKVRLERTETQETCNGGTIIRTNAYISMDKAKVIKKVDTPGG